MLVWLTLHFYDFCGFRSVAVNSVYKLQFFYIYYCNSLLYGVSQANIDRLQCVQAPSTISSADIGRDLHWLPISHRISYKLSLLTWKALYTTEPSYLSVLISPYIPVRTLRSSNTNLLSIPTGVTSHFSCSFSVSAPSTWNSLPQHICSIDRHSTFKHQLKSLLPVCFYCLVTLRQRL